jgi:hypothetical protein
LAKKKREFAFAEYVTPPIQLEAFRRELPGHTFQQFDVDLKTIRTLEHKLIKFQDGREEFYDLRDDPGETVDLSAQGNEVQARLADKLSQWLAALPIRAKGMEPYDILEDEIIRRRLAELGYL